MWTWLLACRPPLAEGDFSLRIEPSAFTPAVSRATWHGPAGDASLYAIPADDLTRRAPLPGDADFAPGDWRLVSERSARDGEDGLPIALLAAGEWRIRVVVEDGGRRPAVSDVTELVVDPPAGLVEGEVHGDPGALGPGFVVAHQYAPPTRPGGSTPLVLDADGRIVWWVPPDDEARALRVEPTSDRSALWVLRDRDGPDDFVERISLDGETRSEIAVHDATHDLAELPDGSLAVLAYGYGPPGTMREWPEWPVAADAVDVIGPDGTAERVYDFLADYPETPSAVCSHVAPGGFVPGFVEWTHANSLIADPDGDGWLVLARHLDTVLHVTRAGEVRWILGGAAATLAPATPGAVFRHGHASHAWREDDGLHLLIFDNRTHDPAPVVSRVLELRIDPEAGTYTQVWSLPDPEGRNTSFLGDAHRLGNGNTLVDWTPFDELAVYAPSGDERWRLELDQALGRALVSPLHP